MFEIDEIKIEHSKKDVVTDNTQPVLSFSLHSDEDGCELSRAVVCVGDIKKEVTGQTGIVLDGLELKPFTEYTVKLTAFDNMGRSASKEADFSTGRLSVPWTANWITDKVYSFAKNTSPAPFTFRKSFSVKKPLKRAFVTATALGIYELNINGKKVGNEYFAPGFTSYKHSLQYNLYDIGDLLAAENTIIAVVGGGLTHAKGETKTPYGMIKIEWTIKDGNFEIEIEVPVSTKCSLTLPDSSAYSFSSGRHAASCRI